MRENSECVRGIVFVVVFFPILFGFLLALETAFSEAENMRRYPKGRWVKSFGRAPIESDFYKMRGNSTEKKWYDDPNNLIAPCPISKLSDFLEQVEQGGYSDFIIQEKESMTQSFKEKTDELYHEIYMTEQKLNALLRKYGWEYKCNFPDSCWRWCKKMEDGRVICVSRAEALQIEENIQND